VYNMDMANRGRPPLPPEETHIDRLSIRARSEEIEVWGKAAEAEDKSFSQAIRDALNAWAKRVLKRKGK
jgi:uncharacterized protein (DUF1778 family)